MSFPGADHIAVAIVVAARLAGEDPLAIAEGARSRARHVAMEALMLAYPDARRAGLGACCGYSTPRAAQAHVCQSRAASWWSEAAVDEVLGAIVADRYGEQAA